MAFAHVSIRQATYSPPIKKKKQTTLVKSYHTKEYTRENIKAKEKEEASITFPDAVFLSK